MYVYIYIYICQVLVGVVAEDVVEDEDVGVREHLPLMLLLLAVTLIPMLAHLPAEVGGRERQPCHLPAEVEGRERQPCLHRHLPQTNSWTFVPPPLPLPKVSNPMSNRSAVVLTSLCFCLALYSTSSLSRSPCVLV